MGLKKDIKDRVAELLKPGDYDIHESESIPGPGDNRLTFGNTGVLFKGSVLFIDMRGSTEVLAQHRSQTVAKIHKAYLYVATTLIAEHGGQIRSYNGDSILAFFPRNTKETIESAVKAAMQIKFMLSKKCAGDFEHYHTLDFGIGIDHGEVLCVKAGKARNDNHNDLLWLGEAVNRAVVLSDSAKAHNHIWISNHCHNNLKDSVQNAKGDTMWAPQKVRYNDKQERAYSTTYHWEVG